MAELAKTVARASYPARAEPGSGASARHQMLEERPEARALAAAERMLNARPALAVQRAAAETLSRRTATDPRPIQREISLPEPNRTGIPDRLKAGIETLSGMSMSDVQVHRNSAEPAKLGALAYARGSDIHLGPGQERHLPHEAWHVVQQKQGRVRTTEQLKGGVGANQDPVLEREADAMGAKALTDLARHAPHYSESRSTPTCPSSVVQRVLSQADRQIYDNLLLEYHGWENDNDLLRDLMDGIVEDYQLPQEGYSIEVADNLAGGARGQTHPPDAIPQGYAVQEGDSLILLNALPLRVDIGDADEGFPRAIATLRHEIQHVLNAENEIGGVQGSAEAAYDEVYGHTEAILNIVGAGRAPDISAVDMIRNYRQALGYFQQLQGSEWEQDANDRLDFCLDKMSDPPWNIDEEQIDAFVF